MEIIKTQKDSKKLLHDGYAYLLEKEKCDRTYWKCDKRGICKGRAIVYEEKINITQNHSHPPDQKENEAKKIISDIKIMSSSTSSSTSNIINECISKSNIDICTKLPKQDSLKQTVRRTRASILRAEDYNKTIKGEKFLMLEKEDIMIYSTETNFNTLRKYKRWFCDGTFDSAPTGKQLYTIHSLVGINKTLPLVYCITNNRNEETYSIIFNFIKNKEIVPISITIDFERAAINEIKNVFPEAKIYGCFFHFGQCLWRKLQGLGLQNWYKNENNQHIIKKFQALAFLPPDTVHDVFNQLINSINDETDEILSDFLQYFETTWLGIVQRGRRRRPTFDIDLWNVFERMERNLPRTNNSVEGWHNAFHMRLQICHPTLQKLLQKIRLEQAATELSIRQIETGQELDRKTKKYDDLNKRLKRIFDSFENVNSLEYIDRIACNL
ncbi:Uncharacterized protein FKW44_004253 [Caligus rogercresseyi]|uniref:MULE transposase domain-containing protein n=1 Tax=Caligus rogercresseyi TaxID=217165 RepID=A0A7T8HLL0_CALRO|nr:Uncharacterized protein FKW44_004253 [Caligus rogercresseyi]